MATLTGLARTSKLNGYLIGVMMMAHPICKALGGTVLSATNYFILLHFAYVKIVIHFLGIVGVANMAHLTIRDIYCCDKLMSHLAIKANNTIKIVYLCQLCANHKVVHVDG